MSVIPIDLVQMRIQTAMRNRGKPVQIGRVGDTTAMGLDCKWYYKGALIDSGAVISVLGAAIVGTIDTYVVVQTICGLVKTDTVTVKTVPVGIKEWDANQTSTVYPNPSNGAFTITRMDVIPTKEGSVSAVVYDLLGRKILQQQLSFFNSGTTVSVQAGKGVYILELTDDEHNSTHQRIVIE